MGFSRAAIVDHAEAFWWRPCEDGIVWIKNDAIFVGAEARKRKLQNYGGAFLWYSTTKLEGLFLLPTAQIAVAKDRTLDEFPSAIMLCSYMDDRSSEAAILQQLKLKPPHFGLNDCTHFTTECLITGGFAVTDEHARRGAPDLYRYLFGHPKAKVLASDVSVADATVVITAGLMRPGDVIVYANRSDGERHHGVVYLGGGTIAMHTYHQFQVAWDEAGGDNQVYSLFHISIDDMFAAATAARWVGWWQVSQGNSVKFIYVGADGHVFTAKTRPASPAAKPKGPDYWFADGLKMRTCVRLQGIVEEYTMAPPSAPTATGVLLNGGGARLTATKL